MVEEEEERGVRMKEEKYCWEDENDENLADEETVEEDGENIEAENLESPHDSAEERRKMQESRLERKVDALKAGLGVDLTVGLGLDAMSVRKVDLMALKPQKCG